MNSDRMLAKVTAGLQADNYPDIAYIYGSDLANLAGGEQPSTSRRRSTTTSTGTASSPPAPRR